MVKTIETPYAEAKRNRLYLPPIDDVTGAVLRDYYHEDVLRDGRIEKLGMIHFPAGYVGSRPGAFVPQADDGDKPYAYKKKQGAV